MTEEERIVKAKVNLLIFQPWFGQLACYLNVIKTDSVPSAAIDEQGNFYFNESYIHGLNDIELRGLVCHEIMHLAFQHPFRIQDRNMVLWNIAADIKVNEEIRNTNGIELPKGGLIPDYDGIQIGPIRIKDIGDKTTEQIYQELYQKSPKFTFKMLSGGRLEVDIENLPPSWKKIIERLVKDLIKGGKTEKPKTSEEIQALAREWKERIDAANQQQKGNVPAGLLRELGELEYPELPWYQIIRQRLARLEKQRTWRRPSKKYLPFFFPGSIKNRSIKAVVAIDTSGSMSKDDITKAISEVFGLARTFKSFKFWICWIDTQVYDWIEVSAENQRKLKALKPKGGGGTDFRPVFKTIKDKFVDSIDCLVFFTDGYGDFPSKEPMYKTYWVTRSNDIRWPFGRIVKLRN
ncbi:hypothetical protein KAW50_03430 [candidate division WOR-3 bacterium]|nr:hypothetical protein [candidate division WOR-3 bacterium]